MTTHRAAPAVQGRRVVVGVAGSIAAYKAPGVIRELRASGCDVTVVPTQAALRFIGAPALAAVSGKPVSTGVFDDPAAVEHVAIGEWADMVLVAPASADLLARIAAGRADDLLTATILTTTAPVVLAPAMHTQMWENPATQENVATLRRRGITVIEPDTGALTSGDSGKGRFPEPARILAEAWAAYAAGQHSPDTEAAADLAGLHIVVSAGGTREAIDPVRFIGNRSSGRQGIAIAKDAAARGAKVSLVAANISASLLQGLPEGVTVYEAPTALEMRETVRELAAGAEVVIMAAAVADYRPKTVHGTKLKKYGLDAEQVAAGDSEEAGEITITLVENPDILAELVSDPPRRDCKQLIVGFAAETGDSHGSALDHGIAKARRKGADLLAVNVVGEHMGFGDVPNALVILDSTGCELARTNGTKDQVAHELLSVIADRLDVPGPTAAWPR